MSRLEDFLTEEEEREVVEAIRLAEMETSGEIRVHLEKHCDGDPLERAKAVFETLGMHQTKLKNGVLFYVAVNDKVFAICGDKGIDDVVADNFWNSTKELMAAQFRQGNFKRGLLEGIASAGFELKRYFPCQDDDVDELSNEISLGE
jgi:uncharacterized membrane protein